MRTPNEPGGPPGADAVNRLAAASDRAARERGRLRASEDSVAGGVIEFQLARQRAAVVEPELVVPLSPREREVAALVAAGRTDGEIADELFISKKTASVHVANVKGKLGASSRVEIALIAARLGLADKTDVGEAAQPARSTVVCPFKGLAAYEVADAVYFFGRERIVGELVARLAGSTFLAIVGPSGSGKSSVARAGLIPALRDGVLPGSGGWAMVVIRPGATPREELQRGLEVGPGAAVTPEHRVVLLVDQFEELFTVCQDEQARAEFVRALVELVLDPARRFVLVLTLRADFYGRCAAYRDLAEVMGTGHVLLGPLTTDELGRAIDAPARKAGLRVEPALVSALVGEVHDRPGSLPLLSTTLLDLWQRRHGRTLRLEAYESLGGVRGAVARLAEAAFGRLTTEQQGIARALLLRLTAEGEGGIPVRRRLPATELEAEGEPDVLRVLAVLTESRLLTADQRFVEVAHEALLTEWPRMRDWLEEDAEGRRIRAHVARTAEDWDSGGRRVDDLYRGPRLAAALDRADGRELELGPLERKFLAESRAVVEREIERERGINRRLRGLLAGVGALFVVALVAAVVAFVQARAAENQAAIAAARELEATGARADAETAATLARARELAAAAIGALEEDPSLSRLLAVAASDLAPDDVNTTTALHRAALADSTLDRYILPDGEPIDALFGDLHPDGRLAVTTGGPFGRLRGSLAVIDLEADTVRWSHRPRTPGVAVGRGFFNPDGSRVVAGSWWEPAEGAAGPPADELGVLVWEAGTGRLLDRIDMGPCGAQVHAVGGNVALVVPPPGDPEPAPDCFSADTRWPLEAVDLGTGARSRLAEWTFADGVLSRDGRFVAFTAGDTEEYVVLELASRRPVMRMPIAAPPQADKQVRALNPDGSIVLVGDRPILAVDVASGEVIAPLGVGEGESFGVSFSPDGSLALAAGRDATLRAWDATTGALVHEAVGAGGGRPSAATDGRVLVTDYATDSATLLDPRTRGEIATVETCRGFVPGGSLEVVGDVAALASECDDDGRTYVVDLSREAVRFEAPGFDGQDLAMSADGARIARQLSTDHIMGPVQILDTASGRVVAETQGLCSYDELQPGPRTETGDCNLYPERPFGLWNGGLRFSPDGRFLAAFDVADREGYVAVWDAMDGRLLHTPTDLGGAAWSTIFTPDSRELLVSTIEGELVGYATDTGRMTRRSTLAESVGGRDRLAFVGFTDDGRTLVAMGGMLGSGGGWLHWVDTATLEIRATTRAHEAAPKAVTMSADGALVASGAADGIVRVRDAASGRLVHELAVNGQAQGVAFVGDDRLAVTPQDGNLLIMALDPRGLATVVRAGISRAFTPEECDRFGFAEACPTLDDLRGGSP